MKAQPNCQGRVFLLAIACGLLLGAAGCASSGDLAGVAPVVPPRALIYYHFTAPLILPDASEAIDELKTDDAPKEVYFRIPSPWIDADFSFGNADIMDAIRKAGIKQIIYADYECRSILGYFKVMRVHAFGYGE